MACYPIENLSIFLLSHFWKIFLTLKDTVDIPLPRNILYIKWRCYSRRYKPAKLLAFQCDILQKLALTSQLDTSWPVETKTLEGLAYFINDCENFKSAEKGYFSYNAELPLLTRDYRLEYEYMNARFQGARSFKQRYPEDIQRRVLRIGYPQMSY